MKTIRDQVYCELGDHRNYYKKLLSLRKDADWQDHYNFLDQQIALRRKLVQKQIKTDNLSKRISQKMRNVAKAYYGIDGYYEKEQIFTQYILQIIKQAIEEVENGKESNNNN